MIAASGKYLNYILAFYITAGSTLSHIKLCTSPHCLRFNNVLFRKGPSIKYVTLFLANFDPPPPCHTLSHIPGPPESTSHISYPHQWRNHTRAITGSARDKFTFARVALVLKMSRVSCA